MSWWNFPTGGFYRQLCAESARPTTFFIDKSHRVFNLVRGVEIFPSGVCAPPFFLRRKSRIFWNFDAINTTTSFPLHSFSNLCAVSAVWLPERFAAQEHYLNGN